MISEDNPTAKTPTLTRWRVVKLWLLLIATDAVCTSVAFIFVDVTLFFSSLHMRSPLEYLYGLGFFPVAKFAINPQYPILLWLLMRRRMDASAPSRRAFLKLFMTSFFIPFALLWTALMVPILIEDGLFLFFIEVFEQQYEIWFTREGKGIYLAALCGSLIASMLAPFIARRFWNTSPQA